MLKVNLEPLGGRSWTPAFARIALQSPVLCSETEALGSCPGPYAAAADASTECIACLEMWELP
jgi:hypothetical protein